MNKVKPKRKEKKNGHMRRGYGNQTEQAAAAGVETVSGVIKHQNGQMKGPALERFDESRDAARFWCKGRNRAGGFWALGIRSFFFCLCP